MTHLWNVFLCFPICSCFWIIQEVLHDFSDSLYCSWIEIKIETASVAQEHGVHWSKLLILLLLPFSTQSVRKQSLEQMKPTHLRAKRHIFFESNTSLIWFDDQTKRLVFRWTEHCSKQENVHNPTDQKSRCMIIALKLMIILRKRSTRFPKCMITPWLSTISSTQTITQSNSCDQFPNMYVYFSKVCDHF